MRGVRGEQPCSGRAGVVEGGGELAGGGFRAGFEQVGGAAVPADPHGRRRRVVSHLPHDVVGETEGLSAYHEQPGAPRYV